MELPSTLRTTYIYFREDNLIREMLCDYQQKEFGEFQFIGEFKENFTKEMLLNEQGRSETDPHNKQTFFYYTDFDRKDEYYGTESILELPDAPKQPNYNVSAEETKITRDKLKVEHRFAEYVIDFSETSLNSIESYKKAKRKYWVYRPPESNNVDINKIPLILFLDGYDYLDTIPMLSILETMIIKKDIPPCIAVFLACSDSDRMSEYDCHAKFTYFLANDFFEILEAKLKLPICNKLAHNTIVGNSASGLAAFYAGLAFPSVFENVIAQSPSFELKKQSDIESIICNSASNAKESRFIIEIGEYQTTPLDLMFKDGTVQSFSSLDASTRTVDCLQSKNIMATLEIYVGGHNYICYKSSLGDHIKGIYNV